MNRLDDDQPSFWRANWIWIAVPLVLVTAVLLWLALDSGPGYTPFTYDP